MSHGAGNVLVLSVLPEVLVSENPIQLVKSQVWVKARASIEKPTHFGPAFIMGHYQPL